MLCENYQEPLKNVAASAGALSAELRSHLEVCEQCRATLSREQSLLAAIDANLQAIANADVPASLLPRVKAAVAELPWLRWRLRSAWIWAPAVAVAALAMALLLPKIREKSRRGNAPIYAMAPVPAVPHTERNQPSVHHSSPPIRIATTRRPSPRAILARATEPQVLVPPGQETALARYLALLLRQPALAQPLVGDESKLPLKIEPLEIAGLSSQRLAIEPLSSEPEKTAR